MRTWCLAAATALVVAGCGSSPAPPAAAPAGADLSHVTLTAAELQGLAASDAAFGTALLRRLQADEPDNLVLSPASIATALQMAYVGARGRTAAEMAAVL